MLTEYVRPPTADEAAPTFTVTFGADRTATMGEAAFARALASRFNCRLNYGWGGWEGQLEYTGTITIQASPFRVRELVAWLAETLPDENWFHVEFHPAVEVRHVRAADYRTEG